MLSSYFPASQSHLATKLNIIARHEDKQYVIYTRVDASKYDYYYFLVLVFEIHFPIALT